MIATTSETRAEQDLSDAALVARVRAGLAVAATWPDSVFATLGRLDYMRALEVSADVSLDAHEAQALAFARALFELARRVDVIEPAPRAQLLELLWKPPAEIARRARPLLLRIRPELETMRKRHQNWAAAARNRERAKKGRVARLTVECAEEDVDLVREFVAELNKKRDIDKRRDKRRPGRPPKSLLASPSTSLQASAAPEPTRR